MYAESQNSVIGKGVNRTVTLRRGVKRGSKVPRCNVGIQEPGPGRVIDVSVLGASLSSYIRSAEW